MKKEYLALIAEVVIMGMVFSTINFSNLQIIDYAIIFFATITVGFTAAYTIYKQKKG